MAEPEVVPALVALGFSLNESRAYAALLQENPATGYEIDVRAQIPRSTVYCDVPLLSQRTGRDVEGVISKMLGPRVGQLDTLLSEADVVGPRASRPKPGDCRRRPDDGEDSER